MPSRFHILGDRGYPCLKYLLTPLNNPQTVAEQQYNNAQSSTRMIIERVKGVLKRRFLFLIKHLAFQPSKCGNLIIACAVLHNIALLNHDEIDIVQQSGISNEEVDNSGCLLYTSPSPRD